MTRAQGAQQEESVGLPLRPDRYRAVWVGFLHWTMDDGSGNKKDTGRVRITTFKSDLNNNPYELDDPTRFNVFARFVVAAPLEHRGKMISMGVNLKKINVDPLGQMWGYSFNEDPTWWHKLTRLMHAAGFEFINDQTTQWMVDVDDFLGEMVSAEHLWLPTPSQVEMGHHGLTGEPLPGVTRELLLMGIEAQLVERPPVVEFTTYLTSAQHGPRKLKVAYDSIKPVPTPEATALWQELARDEEFITTLNRLTYARRARIASPIATATLGVTGYEEVNDLGIEDIPFTPDEVRQPPPTTNLNPVKTPVQERAQTVLQDHINHMVSTVGSPDLRNQVWGIIIQTLKDQDVPLMEGVGFHSIPLPAVEYTYFAVIQAISQVVEGGLTDDMLLTPDQFELVKVGFSDLPSFDVTAYFGLVKGGQSEVAPPPPTPQSRM